MTVPEPPCALKSCNRFSVSGQSPLDGVHQHAGNVDAKRRVQLTNAGGAGDVDFREVITNDIKPHKHQALFLDHRCHPGTDLTVTLGQFPALTPATGGQVAAILAVRRNACKSIGYRLALDQQNTLVTFGDFRDEFLGHGLMAAVISEGFDDDPEIGVVLLDPENRAATHAVHGLHDDVTMLGIEFPETLG